MDRHTVKKKAVECKRALGDDAKGKGGLVVVRIELI